MLVHPGFSTRAPWAVEARFAPLTRKIQIIIDGESIMMNGKAWCDPATALHGRYMGVRVSAFCSRGDFFTNRYSQCALQVDGMDAVTLSFD